MNLKTKNYFITCISLLVVLSGCRNYRSLITDEIVLKDGNSQTGTIINSDSVNLKIRRMDESLNIIPWSAVDTVQGKKLKTLFFGLNLGSYKIPYFSVFRNEAITSNSFGMEYKVGMAMRGVKLFYADLFIAPASPYTITKFGFGYQYYLGGSTYLRKNTFFVGGEANLMSVKYNNAPQLTLEPFTGFERKFGEHIRLHAKLGLQTNFANKNNKIGVNFSIGILFMRRNFKRYYQTLNAEHKLPRK
jgi:hypothetical protein